MEKRKEEQNFFPLRIKLIPIMLILLIIIFNMGAFTSLNESDARDLYDQTRGFLEKLLKEKNSFDNMTYAIFFHNTPIILSGIIPFFGIITIFTSYYTSGLFIGVTAQVTGENRIKLITYTFSFIHTWLELISASIVASESFILSYSLLKKRFNSEILYSFAMAFLAVSIMALAATVETFYIQQFIKK
ncbi:MAG: stage II sporulation protein M [Thermoproteales archaeon]|nr:stage II sporulation protein M [Thermoproteales archaeon]